jgi:cell division protein FtsL
MKNARRDPSVKVKTERPAKPEAPLPRAAAGSNRKFLLLWGLAVTAAALACVAHLALRLQTVRLGYEVGSERRTQAHLVEERRVLSLEAATLEQAPRVEAVARGTLGMDVPDPSRVVPAERRGPLRASGRTR